MRSDPVALTRATRGSSSSGAALSRSVMTSWCTSAGQPASAMARSRIAEQASDVSGVSSDGFQITVSPHTRATAVFHAHTAAGKLNAEMTATTPRGCQVSMSRWPGRSDGIVRPSSWRDRPTAKSQMSIISWISPSASERIFPTSMVTSSARSALCCSSRRPNCLTRAPRAGAGTLRHVEERLVGAGDRGGDAGGVDGAEGDQVAPGDGRAGGRAGAGGQGGAAGGEGALGEGEQVGVGRHGRSLPQSAGISPLDRKPDTTAHVAGDRMMPPWSSAPVPQAAVTSTFVAPSSSLESAGRTTSSGGRERGEPPARDPRAGGALPRNSDDGAICRQASGQLDVVGQHRAEAGDGGAVVR